MVPPGLSASYGAYRRVWRVLCMWPGSKSEWRVTRTFVRCTASEAYGRQRRWPSPGIPGRGPEGAAVGRIRKNREETIIIMWEMWIISIVLCSTPVKVAREMSMMFYYFFSGGVGSLKTLQLGTESEWIRAPTGLLQQPTIFRLFFSFPCLKFKQHTLIYGAPWSLVPSLP